MRVLRLVAGVGFWLVAGGLLAVVTGLATRSLGWLWLAVLLAVAPAQLAFALAGRQGHPVRAAMAAAVAGSLTAAAVAAATPVGTHQLEGVVDRMVLPRTWTLAAESHRGSFLCLPACPTLERRYRVEAGAGQALDTLVAALRGRGFRVRIVFTGAEGTGPVLVSGGSGRVRVTARVVPDPGSPQVLLRLTSTSPLA